MSELTPEQVKCVGYCSDCAYEWSATYLKGDTQPLKCIRCKSTNTYKDLRRTSVWF